MKNELLPEQKIIHPSEVVALYGPFVDRTIFLEDSTEMWEGVNKNQLQATEEILRLVDEALQRGEGLTISLLGNMFSGKTTVVCLVAPELNDRGEVGVYKHQKDKSRTGEPLVTNAGLSIEAGHYGSIEDVDNDKQILIIDEFQFNTIDSVKEIIDFLQKRKDEGKITIISQLDFNYRREPWQTTLPLLTNADRIFVLRARCENCGQPAEFPQREVNGRPAHVDDPEIVVGGKEAYSARCWCCHQVGGKEPGQPSLTGF